MIPIGSPVKAVHGDFVGLVTAHIGAPEGRIDVEVTSIETLAIRRVFAEAELIQLDDEPPVYPVDSEVYFAGQRCIVISHNEADDTYELFGMIEMKSSIVLNHWYPRVPAYQIRLWNTDEVARENG